MDTEVLKMHPESNFEARAARARDYTDMNPDMISLTMNAELERPCV